MNDRRVSDEAISVTSEEGEVIIDGPGGIVVSLTPEAALETADRLERHAVIAAGQRRVREMSKQGRPDGLAPETPPEAT